MATTSSDDFAVAERRQKVSRLHFQGRNKTEIAQELDVSQSTVQRDLQWLMDSWRESAVRDLELMFETELMRLRQLQSEAWQAWERSQWRDGPDGKVQVPGDPRFLNIVFRCLQQVAKLMQMMAGKAKTAKSTKHQSDAAPVSDGDSGVSDSGNETLLADNSHRVSSNSAGDGDSQTLTGQALQDAVAGGKTVTDDANRGQAPASDRGPESLNEAASDENQDQKSDDRNQRGSVNAPIPSTTAEEVLPDYVLASLLLR